MAITGTGPNEEAAASPASVLRAGGVAGRRRRGTPGPGCLVRDARGDPPVERLHLCPWFPSGGDRSVVRAVGRGAFASLVPLSATVAAAILLFPAPFHVWVWGVVALLGARVARSPVMALFRYEVRQSTAEEAAVFDYAPELGCEVMVVEGARDGP